MQSPFQAMGISWWVCGGMEVSLFRNEKGKDQNAYNKIYSSLLLLLPLVCSCSKNHHPIHLKFFNPLQVKKNLECIPFDGSHHVIDDPKFELDDHMHCKPLHDFMTLATNTTKFGRSFKLIWCVHYTTNLKFKFIPKKCRKSLECTYPPWQKPSSFKNCCILHEWLVQKIKG